MSRAEKREHWEEVLRNELSNFATNVKNKLFALVRDDEWPVFVDLAEELLAEYLEDMYSYIVP